MGKFWTVWRPVALRVLRELTIPVVGGVAYGAVVAHAKQSALDGLSAGGVSFFCLLAVQVQLLRAVKNVRSEQSFAEVRDDFISIKDGIEALKEQGGLRDVDRENSDDAQKDGDEKDGRQKALFRNLARMPARRAPVKALAPKQLLELKMPYQAVLNAAVNFEREVRRSADVPGQRTISLAHLLVQPQFNLSKEKLEQLDTLRRVRNSILHGFETLVDPLEAAELVAAYDRAASWFGTQKGGPAQEKT